MSAYVWLCDHYDHMALLAATACFQKALRRDRASSLCQSLGVSCCALLFSGGKRCLETVVLRKVLDLLALNRRHAMTASLKNGQILRSSLTDTAEIPALAFQKTFRVHT